MTPISNIGGNSTSTLLGMLNSKGQSGIDSILSANISASRQRVNKLIEKYTKVSMETDTSKYETVAIDTANTEKFLQALQEPELYSEKRETIDAMVVKYVDKYNILMEDIAKLGGTIDKSYGKKLKELTEENKEKLSAIGITVNKEGKLELNKDTLSKLEVNKIKEFYDNAGTYSKYAMNTMKDISEVINKALKIKQAQTTNYGRAGSYINQYSKSSVDINA